MFDDFKTWSENGVTETYERMDAKWELQWSSAKDFHYELVSDDRVSYSDFVGKEGFAHLVSEIGLNSYTLGIILFGIPGVY